MKLVDLLNERIYADPPYVVITTQADKYAPSPDEISTYLKPLGVPYKTEGKQTNNVPVFSIYLYQAAGSDGTTTQLLKALKGQGELKVKEAELRSFIDRTAAWLKRFFAVHQIDTVIYPQSSSPFLASFVDALQTKHPKLKIVKDAFVKREAHDIDNELDSFIDHEHPEFEKLGAKNAADLKKSVKRELEKAKAEGKPATISAKNIFKGHAKFVHNFMTYVGNLNEVTGKNVLIIDDVLSSGTTFNDMVKQLKKLSPASVQGLTVFKRTSVPVK